MHLRNEKMVKIMKRYAAGRRPRKSKKMRLIKRRKGWALLLGMPTLRVVATHGIEVVKHGLYS